MSFQTVSSIDYAETVEGEFDISSEGLSSHSWQFKTSDSAYTPFKTINTPVQELSCKQTYPKLATFASTGI